MTDRSPPAASWLGRSAALLALVCLFMAVSAWRYRPWWELAFRSDNSPVSWLSAALVFAAAVLCVRLVADGSLPRGRGTARAAAVPAGAG